MITSRDYQEPNGRPEKVLNRGHLARVKYMRLPSGQEVVRKRVGCREFLYNHLFVSKNLQVAGLVPTLLRVSWASMTLEYEFSPGHHLDEIDTRHLGQCYFAAGAALAKLHSLRLTGYGAIFSPRDTRSDWWSLQSSRIAEMLSYCLQMQVLSGSLVTCLRDLLACRTSDLPPERYSCLTHGDYRPDNLLFVQVDDTWSCTVLDFDHVSAAPTHFDFGRIEQDIFEPCAEAREPFLQGYASITAVPDFSVTLPFYRILWPLTQVYWGARNNAIDVVDRNRNRLQSCCE